MKATECAYNRVDGGISMESEHPSRQDSESKNDQRKYERRDKSDKSQESKETEPLLESISNATKISERLRWRTCITYIKFAWAFIESTMVTLARYLNSLSKDQRYIIKVLAHEKKKLKREGGNEYPTHISDMARHHNSQTTLSFRPLQFEDMKDNLEKPEQSPLGQLFLALWITIISHSELLCYFMVILLQINTSSILSLPLSFMVFLWGTLSVPRPTKTFWITLIAYTQAVVIVKSVFQLELFSWSKQFVLEKDPFFPPLIRGTERKAYYGFYELMLLLSAFFHRSVMKDFGLWRTTYVESIELEKCETVIDIEEESEDKKVIGGGSHRLIPVHQRPSRNIFSPSQILHVDSGKFTLRHGAGEILNKRSAQMKLIIVRKNEVELPHVCPHILYMSISRYTDPIFEFFNDLLSSTTRLTADVYAYMFMCDFLNFLVVLFGFAQFEDTTGGVTTYLQENRIPIPFLVMLILQFTFIVIDRAIFLRKSICGKLILQIFIVLGIHVWIFYILPAVTGRSSNHYIAPQIWYVVKCIYLFLSAYQICSGYPTHISGNFLCKKYNIVNWLSFKGFMLIPFLFELRAVMDWVWTDTSMTLLNWLKMENIFFKVFELKCVRQMETEYPQPRGERKSIVTKYIQGGLILMVLIAIIWFPLVLFALMSTVGEINIPNGVTMKITIGSYPSIYTGSAEESAMFRYTESEWMQFRSAYKRNRNAQAFLSEYDQYDIAVAWLNCNSATVWDISPPEKDNLFTDVQSDKPLMVKVVWKIFRQGKSQDIPHEAVNDNYFTMEAKIEGARNPQRDELAKMLIGNDTGSSINIGPLLPKFMKVTTAGDTEPIAVLMDGSGKESIYRKISLSLSYNSSESSQMWWNVQEDCTDDNYVNYLKQIPRGNCGYLALYTFSDKTFPAGLSYFSDIGIIGAYVTVVIVASRFARGFSTGPTYKIMYTELPFVDRVLKLCLDIYLVRECGEFVLEEDLFARLIFLYRSPETLIRWTKHREESEVQRVND